MQRTAIRLDIAYPERPIGIEYEEAAAHTRPEYVLRDAGRYTDWSDAGWRVYRYTKYQVYRELERIVADLTSALARAR